MQIELSDEMARYVQSKALEAGFDNMEAYVLHLVKEQEPTPNVALTYDEWREKYWQFVARQTSRNPHFEDSRESIYLGP